MTSRTDPLRLHKRDRPDFERVLHQALQSDHVQQALRASSSGAAAAVELRARARDDADSIVSASREEYAAYLRLRTGADKRAARLTRPSGAHGQGLPAALAVLTPAISGTAAAIFLLLGYGMRLTGTHQELAGSLVRTGWAGAALAALALAAGMAGVLLAALRNRAAAKRSHGRAGELEQARKDWQSALLERGMLPFVQHLLAQWGTGGPETDGSSAPAKPPPPRRYSSPDFTAPDYSGPDFGR
ncbi:hypothetical protein [Streptomyces axinellae]|uniref:Membrane protein n=1 Tax=Streptomyces axinellae TaxID=552788 RepID=A0ABN3QX62_9ACTN